MNTEKQIENIQNFTLHRPYILTIVNHGKPQKSETSSEEYLVQLMNMPVSKASIFGDDVWEMCIRDRCRSASSSQKCQRFKVKS